MQVHLIAAALNTDTVGNVGPAYNLVESMKDNHNRNNIGSVMFHNASGTIKIQGSCDGTNWVDVATGVTASVPKTLALFPQMRAWVTNVGTGNAKVYIIQ